MHIHIYTYMYIIHMHTHTHTQAQVEMIADAFLKGHEGRGEESEETSQERDVSRLAACLQKPLRPLWLTPEVAARVHTFAGIVCIICRYCMYIICI